ncbi:AAA family ATPase [Thalassobellus suaedae]|uniref:AAA family ATPase n=1 Tax=Thalassobellus suaedae TaxID=3074124 RepID=A0ABY9Y6M1_9FLAO|nr:AAA family ATPase [Flavobacteriaceae bacterium HL-DH10]
MIKKSLNDKGHLTFKEVLKELKTRPKPKFLWHGIKEKSFGLVFGPSKSGKTIFCENLAMKLAYGAKEFFGYELDGKPKKILFVGLEEFWENRAERNKIQYNTLNDVQKKLVDDNYMYQGLDFQSRILSDKDWTELKHLIKDSGAEVVFIDSITRMNPGKLEDSSDAEKVMQRLRNICYDLGVTLICIHHTPKMYDKPLVMDSIKGSSVFAQESDFALGINRTSKGVRYLKDIFFRYAPDDNEKVNEFSISSETWLECYGDADEGEILNRSDRRRVDDNRDKIIQYFDSNTCTAFETAQLVRHFTTSLTIKERQVKYYLSELVKEKKISNPKKGKYKSNKCSDDDEGKEEN